MCDPQDINPYRPPRLDTGIVLPFTFLYHTRQAIISLGIHPVNIRKGSNKRLFLETYEICECTQEGAGYFNVKVDGIITNHPVSPVFFNFLQYTPMTYEMLHKNIRSLLMSFDRL
jgi:hypothetical protein